MNQVDPKWYFLCILVLVFGALTLPRMLDFPAYSEGDAYELCSGVFSEYELLANANAPEEEWQAFEQRALPELEAYVNDYERHPSIKRGKHSLLHQVARYNIPKAIQKRGKIPERDVEGIAILLAEAHKEVHAPPPRPVSRPSIAKPGSHERWDPVIVAVIIGDILLAVIGGGYWFLRT